MHTKDWKEIGLSVKDELISDNISIVSAGVAYYFFLALFPTLIAAISIYGLVMDPAQVQQQIGLLSQMLPEQAAQMLSDILNQLAGKATTTLGWGLALSLLFSLWSAHKGTSAVFTGINIAYGETDDRGFFRRTAVILLFTLGGIIAGIICTAFVAVFPVVVESINLPSFLQNLIEWLRWPLVAVIIVGALALTYKTAIDRKNTQYQWTSLGTIIATVVWLLGSLLFSFYIDNFSSYDKIYGSFAAVIILLLWFYITAFIILLGAEINAEME